MIAKLCGKRFADLTVGKVESDVLKGLHHAATAKPAEFTTITGTAVLRLSLGQLLKVGTSFQEAIDRVNLLLAYCLLLFGSTLREELEDVLGMDIITVTHIVDADHVDAIGSLKRI